MQTNRTNKWEISGILQQGFDSFWTLVHPDAKQPKQCNPNHFISCLAGCSLQWLEASFQQCDHRHTLVWWGELAFSKVPGLGSSKGILRTRCLQSGLSFRIAESMQAAYQIWRESEVFHDFKMFARWYPTDCGSIMVRAENICLTEWFKEHTVQIFSIANIWRGS